MAYGDGGLDIEVDAAAVTVVEPIFSAPAPDPSAALRRALQAPVAGAPLRDRVRPGQTVAIAACDITPPQPRRLMIPVLLTELDGLVDLDNVTVIVATGTHRGSTEAELVELFGEEVVGSVRVVNHDSRNRDSLSWQGLHGNQGPVWLARGWVEADVKTTTRCVEPHFFAGFSGGPKLVAPGLAGLDTTLTLHDAQRIGSEQATWGICEGNPVHDDVRAIAAATGVGFALDVVLNREQQVVAAFGGEVLAMHAAARAYVREVSMRPVDGLFDVVVTTNAGFPLDQNLYQAVKGMSAAATVVAPGGLIICAAECADGFPDHGSFRAELAAEPTPERLLASIAARTTTVPDQWQVQVLARVLRRARVGVHASGLSEADLRSAHLFAVPDIAAAVAAGLAAAGPGARGSGTPEGPQTIPFVGAEAEGSAG